METLVQTPGVGTSLLSIAEVGEFRATRATLLPLSRVMEKQAIGQACSTIARALQFEDNVGCPQEAGIASSASFLFVRFDSRCRQKNTLCAGVHERERGDLSRITHYFKGEKLVLYLLSS